MILLGEKFIDSLKIIPMPEAWEKENFLPGSTFSVSVSMEKSAPDELYPATQML